jgi:hypothetical protein
MRLRWKILGGVILVVVILVLVAGAYINIHDPLVETRATSVAAQDADLMGRMQGYWQDADRGLVIGFEGHSCCYTGNLGFLRMSVGAPVQFCHVEYRTNGVILQTWSPFQSKRATVSVQDSGLLLGLNGASFALTHLANKPPELDMSPLTMPSEMTLPPAQIDTMRKELTRRDGLEQEVRRRFAAQLRKGNAQGKEVEAITREMNMIDTDNRDYVRRVIQEFGWVDASRFGRETSINAMMLVHKSGDLRLMLTALPHLESDAKAGRIDGEVFCLMYDRVQTEMSRPQRYGTQVVGSLADDRKYLYPLEDRQNLPRLRSEMGLPRFKVYLNILSLLYGMKDICTMDQLISAEPTSAGDVATRAAPEK